VVIVRAGRSADGAPVTLAAYANLQHESLKGRERTLRRCRARARRREADVRQRIGGAGSGD
jgi:hypothetical protein